MGGRDKGNGEEWQGRTKGKEMNGTSPRKMGKSLGRISVPQIAQILALKPQEVPFGTEIILLGG